MIQKPTPLVLISTALLLLLLSSLSRAEQPVLQVKGRISPVSLTLTDLQAMPTTEVSTQTIWTDRKHRFSAVSVQTLLNELQVPDSAKTLTMVALNDYSIEVEIATLIQHNAFIAFAMDGETMRIRDKGPLWVLYPFSDQPEINIPPFQAHAIWQLKTLIIH